MAVHPIPNEFWLAMVINKIENLKLLTDICTYNTI